MCIDFGKYFEGQGSSVFNILYGNYIGNSEGNLSEESRNSNVSSMSRIQVSSIAVSSNCSLVHINGLFSLYVGRHSQGKLVIVSKQG
jgi:hypothetical protein